MRNTATPTRARSCSGQSLIPTRRNDPSIKASRCTRGWTGAGQTFNFYGAVASRQTWTWTWQTNMQCGDAGYDTTNGYISGIMRNTTTYDYDLLSTPPPGFPVTGGSSILAWREVLTRP
jgi:hypothetical protein